MLRIDESRQASGLLGIGDDMTAERCFARGFGTIDLYHASARHTADTKGEVQRE
jgi:hypothetical protein